MAEYLLCVGSYTSFFVVMGQLKIPTTVGKDLRLYVFA